LRAKPLSVGQMSGVVSSFLEAAQHQALNQFDGRKKSALVLESNWLQPYEREKELMQIARGRVSNGGQLHRAQ
jgi:hypothetical protein